MPEALTDGHYKREQDASDPDEGVAELMKGQVQAPTSVFGAYLPANTDKPGSHILTVTGVYGTVLSPVTARDELLQILDSRWEEHSTVVGPRLITPTQSAEPLQCRVSEKTATGSDSAYLETSCAWADASSVVEVVQSMGLDVRPEEADLDAFASTVAAIRGEVRRS
ncbi:hypothetical protein OHU11_09640 [Streptomyces sp. NBC_00257]|uniref:hypothetical protein n=1 Tax=unclassified Streptomyces TaxID=2593676 RepID=UPI00224CC27B|nr:MULTISPECIES: hypothetical protein [unclassified Streptomyces]MCX5427935.1 hypothetical protein [Streptomyces sp. NBC_00062]